MTAATAAPLDRETICQAIGALYEETDIAFPTPASPVAPLGPILERLPLHREEMRDLTSRRVQTELIRRRALRGVEDLPDVSDDALAGFLFACGSFAWIFIAAGDDQPTARKRFSAAHELGHYALHFRSQLAQAPSADSEEQLPNWRDEFKINEMETAETHSAEPSRLYGPDHAHIEREANRFAAELLMPEMLVSDLWTHWRERVQSKDLVARLAETLLVSHEAMRIRLQTLNLR